MFTKSVVVGLAIFAIAIPTIAIRNSTSPSITIQTKTKGTAVAYPWTYEKGTGTARLTAASTAEEIMRNAGYASIPKEVAAAAWKANKFPQPVFGTMPTNAMLKSFGKSVGASKVVFGSVSWRTRSIWVNVGPKTISTATVNAYVFDVATGKIIYKRVGVGGRSDERSKLYKLALDVLISPLVTIVSGGPATPQEQRAVQIALGIAYHDWVKPKSATK